SRLVGRYAFRFDAIPTEPIWPRQVADNLPWLQSDGKWPVRVRAAIDNDMRIERQQAASLIGIGGQIVIVLAAVGAGHQVFTSILDIPERSLELPGQPCNA